MKELYGIFIFLPVAGQMLPVKIPGWLNIGVLRARATSLPFTRANRAQRRRHGMA